jgi:hypothetical protein
LHCLANLKANQGDVDGAIDLYGQSLAIYEQIEDMQGKAMALQWIGQLEAYAQQDYETGVRYLQESAEILEQIDPPEAATSRRALERIQQMAEEEENSLDVL